MKILALVQILGMLSLGFQGLTMGSENAHSSTESSCCCAADAGCAQKADCEDEENSSCTAGCDCGCSILAALGGQPTELPGNKLRPYRHPVSGFHYAFDFKSRLFHPPIFT